MMNVVNFSDGVDGLAAGVCMIIAARDGRDRLRPRARAAGVLAALTAGAALGFLIYNFPPASSFMGDCGANLLGLLMGVIAVEGRQDGRRRRARPAARDPGRAVPRHGLRRAQAPEVPPAGHRRRQRALPSPDGADRLLQPAHDAYLYAWTFVLAGLALALRFIPYSDHQGQLDTGWTLVIVALGLLAVAASVYLGLRAGDPQVQAPAGRGGHQAGARDGRVRGGPRGRPGQPAGRPYRAAVAQIRTRPVVKPASARSAP